MPYLVDSGALLALVDARDKYHQAAASFVQTHPTDLYYVPETIFMETMVLTKARLGSKPAIELGQRLRESSIFQTILLTDDDREKTWQIFSQYSDKDWSYVDCSILALAQRLGIAEVFSFDRHIEQMAVLIRVPSV